MIKYFVEAVFWGQKLRKIEDWYGEKELNAAVQNITGLIRESLVSKKVAVEYIHLYKVILTEDKKEEVLLMYFHAEEFSYRYVIRKLGGNKNEKENDVNFNDDHLYDAFN